jgi:hypothetical protein
MWDLGRGAREAAQRHAAHLAAEEASEEARLSGADPDEVEAAATRAALAIMSTYDQDEAPVWTDEGSSVWSSDPEAPADPEVEELVARRRKALQAKADKIMQAEVEKLREGVRDQLKLEAAVVDAVFRRTATAEAEVRLRAANAAPAPEPVSLQSFLLMEDGEEEWWVEGLLPQDGITLLSAPQKSGKTTLIGNLVRTLVDGDKFLNAFTVKRCTAGSPDRHRVRRPPVAPVAGRSADRQRRGGHGRQPPGPGDVAGRPGGRQPGTLAAGVRGCGRRHS